RARLVRRPAIQAPALQRRALALRPGGRWGRPGPRALRALPRPPLHQPSQTADPPRPATPQLTPRQWEQLRQVAAGHTNAQVAPPLGVSKGTVRIHPQNIYGRLQVSSRTAAVTRAFPDLAAL